MRLRWGRSANCRRRWIARLPLGCERIFAGAVPPLVGHDELLTCSWAGAGQGGLAAPLAIPGIPGWLALRVPSSLAPALRDVIDALPTRR